MFKSVSRLVASLVIAASLGSAAFAGPALAASKAPATTLRGTVVKVVAHSDECTLKSGTHDYTIKTGPKTAITVSGKKSGFSALKVGDSATATGTLAKTQLTASKVIAEP